jgi:hypothetical protein
MLENDKKNRLNHLKGELIITLKKPVETRKTASTGTVLPRVTKSHTVPVPV